MSRNSKSRELNWDFLSQYFEVDSSSVTGLTWKEREESVGRWNEQYAEDRLEPYLQMKTEGNIAV